MPERERNERKVATYEGRLDVAGLHPLFDAIAEHMAHVEHCLFVELFVRGREHLAVKREALARFGITARQFNAVAFDLVGRVEAARGSQEQQRESLQRRIDSGGGWIKAKTRKVKALTKMIATEERRISSPRGADRLMVLGWQRWSRSGRGSRSRCTTSGATSSIWSSA